MLPVNGCIGQTVVKFRNVLRQVQYYVFVLHAAIANIQTMRHLQLHFYVSI